MSDLVLTSFEDGVAIVTINRPEARNAVNRAVADAVAEAVDELDARDDLVVGVITGAGGTFCAGADLKALAAGERSGVPGRGFCGITETPPVKPLIAAVEGYALGGGTELALACDMVVAARTAKFGLPETKRGLVAAGGGLVRLPRKIPYNIAMQYALTGDFLGAERGYELGLVNELTVQGEALAGALALARAIAANGPLAVRASKAIVVDSADWPAGEVWDRNRAACAPVFASGDAKEGARAFAEKRAPVWGSR
ncbi:crotonase/enoyl-CoA hydratase family protein [Streptomyces sp. NBC_01022]|uniref:crotonase/enoyl-CoA hydratase family protein n=1 Tax=Streptomyces sp. NBC_01022 TaxID=2903723 RepID=UPI002DDA641A|nr:crotonase/enoyl-CoA hydratase family protein [Streptomyces sp. NBC_01022]WRZ79175.1 crotonase/enoyl-CoA hydratase family protein [Streptomyces sp. NBC_01022]WRZ86501.1 crotonase/enoyl-CoA hydratase family protein [Streptomyces sp. NBC_01022]